MSKFSLKWLHLNDSSLLFLLFHLLPRLIIILSRLNNILSYKVSKTIHCPGSTLLPYLFWCTLRLLCVCFEHRCYCSVDSHHHPWRFSYIVWELCVTEDLIHMVLIRKHWCPWLHWLPRLLSVQFYVIWFDSERLVLFSRLSLCNQV